ncbi:MAG: hypothetical protein JW910_20010, partial [Anaerolineae bacterium]|nr:hypothetical protein [Anaerolineae bacterium]
KRRIDTVAYSLAVGLAFATVFNLRFALLEGGGQPGAAAIRITSLVLAQQGLALVMGHRLMALKFTQSNNVVALPLSLLLAGFLHGIYIAVRAGFTVSGFGIGATANSALLGFIFSVVFAVVLFGVYGFLIRTADARDAQRIAPR